MADQMRAEVVIIGAGLTGLTIAYYLKKKDISAVVVEARDRIGGRIHTMKSSEGPPIELGATWLGSQHRELLALCKDLAIDVFPQRLGDTAIYEPISTSPPQLVQLPPNDQPSYRIAGGTDQIIQGLARNLDSGQILTGVQIKSIRSQDDGLEVQAASRTIVAQRVVSTLPPRLLLHVIQVVPGLPESFTQVAERTHTWMADSIKVALTFDQPFWRSQSSSGTIFSNVGPIPEMYDHASYDDRHFALMGFMNGTYFSLDREQRLERILAQLKRYYGDDIANFIRYDELVWHNELHTSTNNAHVLPHENNGHPVFAEAYCQGRLLIAGTETSPEYSGYMEGAVRSAQRIIDRL